MAGPPDQSLFEALPHPAVFSEGSYGRITNFKSDKNEESGNTASTKSTCLYSVSEWVK